jgi:uncharacterized YigZ family protein
LKEIFHLHINKWRSLTKESHTSIEIKKSVFIAEAAPITSAEDAQRFINERKKRYPDATHHVYAWRVGITDAMQKYSDDGEPAGTAGLPVLDILRKNGIDDSIIVVTRYFGGVQLGTGGLARAYGKAAGAAVSEAIPCVYVPAARYEVSVNYSQSDRLIHAVEREGISVESVRYEQNPVLLILCDEGQEDRLLEICGDTTSGQAEARYIGPAVREAGKVGELSFDA